MKPAERQEEVSNDDLLEITDQVNLAAYLEKDENGNFKDIILRVYKENVYEGLAINIGTILSPKILKYFDENGKFQND
ncbi:MAG TPA: hypothetical protein VMZ91_01190 [Candidatus Paceibacterota bacterium]|nr:hypothetical protein [Candidatus Paceibacterota bacterium]